MSDQAYAKAELVRPVVRIDLSGAVLTQDAVNTLVDLARNSAADYECIDIHLERVSRASGVPNLTVTWPENA